ncbi:MAG: hypothetical protein IKC03_09685 [Oscillospiraceae bacterium]|nr:hypothetical protein [Oscillospiraceae bacterium]
MLDVIPTVHFVVTDDKEYGRFASVNALTSDVDFQKMLPLFRQAIGSAGERKEITDSLFREMLQYPGIYLDLTVSLPMSVVAAWLGEASDTDESIRALALVAEQETTKIFFYQTDGSVICCSSALSSSAVREITAGFAPNGGKFAFESEYTSLAPYMIMEQEMLPVTDLYSSLPNGYSSYNLLTALDFNAHTYARYVESSGVEVVMQSPRTLRIGTDGLVHYRADGEVDSELYRIVGVDHNPTAAEVLRSVSRIAYALTTGTNASTLGVSSIEQIEDGWEISFHYQVNGVKVYLPNDQTALRVLVKNNIISEFEFYCRSYEPLEQISPLLPLSIATSIASLYRDEELVLAYVDQGGERIHACWFAE